MSGRVRPFGARASALAARVGGLADDVRRGDGDALQERFARAKRARDGYLADAEG